MTGFFSLSIMFSRVIHTVAWISEYFLPFIAELYLIGWIYFFPLSIHQVMGIWAVPTFWLLCITLLWTFMYSFLWGPGFWVSWYCLKAFPYRGILRCSQTKNLWFRTSLLKCGPWACSSASWGNLLEMWLLGATQTHWTRIYILTGSQSMCSLKTWEVAV